jgi:hypothetical protein
MLMSHHQNAGQNHNIKIANRSYENQSINQSVYLHPQLLQNTIGHVINVNKNKIKIKIQSHK